MCSAFIKQIQQFFNFLLFSDLREMDWWASLLTVCWKLFAKRLQSPQPTEWKVGRTKLILASELGLMFCGWISVFNLETVPSLKYWLLARMCHRGPPRLKLKVENSFILCYFYNQKTSRWRATWGSSWWPGWRRVAAGSWCRQWWWPGSGINKWLERNGDIVLLILINIPALARLFDSFLLCEVSGLESVSRFVPLVSSSS